jgi:hypothetical protein
MGNEPFGDKGYVTHYRSQRARGFCTVVMTAIKNLCAAS